MNINVIPANGTILSVVSQYQVCIVDINIHVVLADGVTNYVHYYSAHDHQRHVTRILEESHTPIGDHKTLYHPSFFSPPIVALPHMLHFSVPLVNPQTARTSHYTLTPQIRSYALACMPVLPPFLHREEP